ncbi:MAG TPA: cobyric acid synthase CobQ, partial [Stellaceae bacterium]|nr:cobyric acid synthase CobQ [Stellaceae bacterium]
DIATVLGGEKRLTAAAGVDVASGARVRGYEMHVGITTGPGLARPMLRLGGRDDGCASADGRVAGCYLHGLFASDAFRAAFLRRLGAAPGDILYEAQVKETLDRFAEHLERSLDLAALLAAARPPRLKEAA